MTLPDAIARIATLDAELEKARAERDEAREDRDTAMALSLERADRVQRLVAERDALRAALIRMYDRASEQPFRDGWADVMSQARAALESTPAPDVKERAAAIVAKAMRREGPKQPPEAVLALYDTIEATLGEAAQRGKAAALPPGHVAVPRQLLVDCRRHIVEESDGMGWPYREGWQTKLAAELRELLGGGG